jgi:hypothetical protein
MNDTLERWEQWPVAGLVLAAGLNTAIWYAGRLLPGPAWVALPWLITLAAIASVVAIDGSLVATIAGMREGRRSKWSTINICVTATFTGLAALAAHGVLSVIGPALHGLFAVTIVTYALHLAEPRAAAANLPQVLADAERENASLRAQLAAERERPVVLRLEDAARMLIAAGAPEATIRTWRQQGRLREPEE